MEDTEQEELKVKLRQTTALLEGKLNSGWETTSGMVDAIAGTVGKNSPAGKNVARIRSSVRRGPNPPEDPVPPTP